MRGEDDEAIDLDIEDAGVADDSSEGEEDAEGQDEEDEEAKDNKSGDNEDEGTVLLADNTSVFENDN